MPRLSDYLEASRQQQPASTASPVTTPASAATAPVASALPTPKPATTASPATLKTLHDRYVEQYRRRVRTQGPRSYRHPDGSLRPDPPAADFYSRAVRVHWSELISYCRTHGGDREYDTNGFSLRYGVGVPEEAHRALCEALDLREELQPPLDVSDEAGDPLDDPAHPFNNEWKQVAQQVLAMAPGRYAAPAGTV